MDGKKSFLVYYDIKEILDELSDEDAGKLFKAMVEYEVAGTEPDFGGALKLAWIPIRQTLQRSGSKYEEMVQKRKKAGQKGGLASGKSRRSKTVENTGIAKQNEANEADSDSERVRDSERDSDNDSECVSDSDSERASVTDIHQAHTDAHTHHISSSHYDGAKHNVELTEEQYNDIRATYQSPHKLIDKVSMWLPSAKKPVPDHYSLVLKFAMNDNWPKKPKVDSQPVDIKPKARDPMPEEMRLKYMGGAR